MLRSGRRYAWPAVNRCIDILPEPWTLVRGPRSKHLGPWSKHLGPWSKHIGPWFTDLEPWVVGRIPRLKLRGSRLVDAGPGVTEAGCEISIELDGGAGPMLGGGRASDLGLVVNE